MILTKEKQNEISSKLHVGVNNISMVFDTNSDERLDENFWIAWAKSFQSICKDYLGLEIIKGPGTSLGIIQTSIGPVRYQYDCDWNEIDGRVGQSTGLYTDLEKGTTLWEGTRLWNTMTNENGIDVENKRFDFIVLFTMPSEDVRDGKEGQRLGLRFKYPLTHERGYNCSYYLPYTPALTPWIEGKDGVDNDIYFNSKKGQYQSGRDGRLSGDVNTWWFLRVFNKDIFMYTDGTIEPHQTSSFNRNKISYNWEKYSDVEKEGLVYYSDLGRDYSDYNTHSFSQYNICQILISENYETINFRIKNSNNNILFDILYGNLITEQYEDNNILKEVVPSFVSVITQTGKECFSDFLLTDSQLTGWVSKQINRPQSIDEASPREYWGISRVTLLKEYLPCKDLYQVFSFSDLMANSIYEVKTFIDSNGVNHDFILFNHGYANTPENAKKTVALAIPVEGGSYE